MTIYNGDASDNDFSVTTFASGDEFHGGDGFDQILLNFVSASPALRNFTIDGAVFDSIEQIAVDPATDAFFNYLSMSYATAIAGGLPTIHSVVGRPITTIVSQSVSGSYLMPFVPVDGDGIVPVVTLRFTGSASGTLAANPAVTFKQGFWGAAGDDTLIGSDRADEFTGSAGTDMIQGKDGEDSLFLPFVSGSSYPPPPSDMTNTTFDGGAGNDTVTVLNGLSSNLMPVLIDVENLALGLSEAYPNDVVFSAETNSTFLEHANIRGYGEITVYFTGAVSDLDASGITFNEFTIDGAVQTALAGATFIFDASNHGGVDNHITGTILADTIYGGGGNDKLVGGNGFDLLYGGEDDDVLDGGKGADLLDGGLGADAMTGGKGGDSYVVDDAGDVVTELSEQGQDKVTASVNYTLTDNVENLFLSGAANGTGNDGANRIFADVTLASTLSGERGADTLTGSTLGDVLVGGAGSDTLKGGNGDDVLNGQNGTDVVLGQGGNDRLIGGDGDDVLNGGAGSDRLTGDSGADTFVFDDKALIHGTQDRITDFSSVEGDRIDLSAIDADGSNPFTFMGTAAFDGGLGELRYFDNGLNTFVEGDIDGDMVADFTIFLNGVHTLAESDFVL